MPSFALFRRLLGYEISPLEGLYLLFGVRWSSLSFAAFALTVSVKHSDCRATPRLVGAWYVEPQLSAGAWLTTSRIHRPANSSRIRQIAKESFDIIAYDPFKLRPRFSSPDRPVDVLRGLKMRMKKPHPADRFSDLPETVLQQIIADWDRRGYVEIDERGHGYRTDRMTLLCLSKKISRLTIDYYERFVIIHGTGHAADYGSRIQKAPEMVQKCQILHLRRGEQVLVWSIIGRLLNLRVLRVNLSDVFDVFFAPDQREYVEDRFLAILEALPRLRCVDITVELWSDSLLSRQPVKGKTGVTSLVVRTRSSFPQNKSLSQNKPFAHHAHLIASFHNLQHLFLDSQFGIPLPFLSTVLADCPPSLQYLDVAIATVNQNENPPNLTDLAEVILPVASRLRGLILDVRNPPHAFLNRGILFALLAALGNLDYLGGTLSSYHRLARELGLHDRIPPNLRHLDVDCKIQASIRSIAPRCWTGSEARPTLEVYAYRMLCG